MRQRLILNSNKLNLFFPFCLALSFLLCLCQSDPALPTGIIPSDKAEFESVWQYLKAFSIYQDRIPNNPFVFKHPSELLYSIADTFKGRPYTDYYYGNDSYQASSGKYGSTDIVVSFEMLTGTAKTGILKITTFHRNYVYTQFLNCITKIPASCENLIIDLRGNGGGYIPQVISVVEAFLTRGTAYITATERNLKFGSEAATIKGPWYTGGTRHPALAGIKNRIVWMDGETASASEILAVALKDCASAILVGSRSSGKGIGQVILERNNRPSLMITYLMLSGKPGSTGAYHGVGLTPDVEINGSSENEKLAAVVRLVEPEYTGKIKSPPALSFQKTSAPACFKIIHEDSLDLKSDH
jgi:hypothetical protein